MAKRKAENVSESQLRAVLREETNLPLVQQACVLNRMEGRAFRHDLNGRYDISPELFERIHFQAIDKGAEAISLPILCLPAYMQQKCQLHPHWADIVAKAAVDSGSSGLRGILYCDEVVPGNVLRPDNARKSYLYYISWSNLGQATRSQFSWATVLVARHSLLNRIPGGLAGLTQAIVAHLEPCFAGFPVQDSQGRSHLLRTTKLYLLADEAALKGAVGSKGSAGLRPCILCANALDKTRPQVPGHESIASHNFAAFQPLQQPQLDAYMAHLASLPTKSKLEESQTLLGWRFIPESIVSRPGLLIAERCIYDAMHCYWSQGTVNCEVGLLLASVKEKIGLEPAQLAQQLRVLKWCCPFYKETAPRVLSEKLLQAGVDYKGTAKQTLLVLPLLNFFAQEVLSQKDELQQEIECLRRLNTVCRRILLLKCQKSISQADANHLVQLQQDHLQAFKACYGERNVKPKHHYSFHTSQPAVPLQIFLDTFVCERKNKNFKQLLGSRACALRHFEMTAMATLISHELKWKGNWSPHAVLSEPQAGKKSERLHAHAECQGQEYHAGLYILSKCLAVHVRGFVETPKAPNGAQAVADQLCCKHWKEDYSTWSKPGRECAVKLEDLRAAWRPNWILEEACQVISLQ